MFIPTAASGNGLCLATFGRSGELMGFFYPRIDFAQNVREGMTAIRLLDGEGPGRFLWCFDDRWRTTQSFEPASNVLVTRLDHGEIELVLEIIDVLPPNERALMRRIRITRGENAPPVQFMHYFRMSLGDTDWRNGVQAYPDQNAVIQYFRDINLAVTANRPFTPFCGSIRDLAHSPTKEAMQAGHFDPSIQAIGRVEFAIGFMPIHEHQWETTLVLVGAASREDALASARRIAETRLEVAIKQANDRAVGLLARAGQCPLPELSDAFERAVISFHDLYDESARTFIAAPEFDHAYELSGGYGYCWPRDAAICAVTGQRIGRPEMAFGFFEWSAKTQLASGHWFQRSWVDGFPAPSWCVHDDRIQLDQTCAILHAAGQFARQTGKSAKDFVDSYRPVAQQATQAILNHIGPDGLHRPATDLWENSIGTFAYTQAAVIASLREADEVFGLMRDRTGPVVRQKLKQKLIETFWQSDRHRWIRGISPNGEIDAVMDSSAMGIIEPWNILDLHNLRERLLALETLEGISQDLRTEVKSGRAILRFAGEAYMGGGPGCVNTLWLALCRLRLAATATSVQERKEQIQWAIDDIRVVLANTSPTGQLPEMIPKIGYDYWAAPHGWASALLIGAILTFREMSENGGLLTPATRLPSVRRRAPLS